MTQKKTKVKTKRKTANPVRVKSIRKKPSPRAKIQPPGKRRDALRAILIARRRDLLRDVEEHLRGHLQATVPALENEVLDSGDQATQDVSEEMYLSFQERRTQNLKSVDEALQRLEDETYGICDECGADIPETRLTALPFAKLCVPCQDTQETLERIEREEDRFK